MQLVCGSGTACGRCPWTTSHRTPTPDSAGWQRTCAPPSPFCVCGHLLSAPWQSAGRCPEPEPGVVRCRGREAWQDRNTRFSSPCARGGCRLGQSLGGRSLPPARCRACLGRCQSGRRGGAVSSVDRGMTGRARDQASTSASTWRHTQPRDTKTPAPVGPQAP